MDTRVLEHVRELEQAFELEVAVWGLDPRDAVPVTMLRAIQHAGGALIGAYDGTQIVGITLGFPARADDRWVLWSHMTGIDRAYQGRGVGFDLKCFQREWALAHGFDEIRWTFDPLQRGNANFNLHRLGATANLYHINFYGVMADDINQADVPSDRIEAVWRLRDPRVGERLSAEIPAEPAVNRPFLLIDERIPRLIPLDERQPELLAQIPPRLTDPLLALDWRLALRAALTRAFGRGYSAVDFTENNAYLLKHP